MGMARGQTKSALRAFLPPPLRSQPLPRPGGGKVNIVISYIGFYYLYNWGKWWNICT